jgi:hypothetical protein
MARFVVQRSEAAHAVTVSEVKEHLRRVASEVKFLDETPTSLLVEASQDLEAQDCAPAGWTAHPLRSTPRPRTRPVIRAPAAGPKPTKKG